MDNFPTNTSELNTTNDTPQNTLSDTNPVIDRYQNTLDMNQSIQDQEYNVIDSEHTQALAKDNLDHANFFNQSIRERQLEKAEEKTHQEKSSLNKLKNQQAYTLGGETLVNSNPEIIKHATNPKRLETLIDANQKGGPQEHLSQEGQDFFQRQENITPQLKHEGEEIREQELKEKALEKFLNTHIKKINEYNQEVPIWNKENRDFPKLIIDATQEEVQSIAKISMKSIENSQYLPTEKTYWGIKEELKKTQKYYGERLSVQEEILKSHLEADIDDIKELEKSFYTKLAFLTLAKKDSEESNIPFNFEKFINIYNHSKEIVSREPDHFKRLRDKSKSHELNVMNLHSSRGFERGFTSGLCQECAEALGKINITEFTKEDDPYIFAYNLAILENNDSKKYDTQKISNGSLIEGIIVSKSHKDVQFSYSRIYPEISQKTTLENINSISRSLYLAHRRPLTR